MYDAAACKWLVNRTNSEYVEYLARTASLSPAFAQVLINRGIKSPAQLDSFLDPSLSRLSDPFNLPSLGTALERIRYALRNGERILIHGDYDADGVTATAIMVEGLRERGGDVHYFIPDRLAHGYGFGPAGIEKAIAIGAKLIITVDCGITSFEAVVTARSLGIDVIVTDHHEAVRSEEEDSPSPFLLPDAVAVINPKVFPEAAHLTGLSGAGVAFKVMQGLFGNDFDPVHRFLDLAALGTAADVVPAVGDNRIMLKEGIKLIHAGQRAGIRALKSVAGIRSDFFKTSLLYYLLIPRINAAGRIADATDVVRLLTTRSDSEAEDLALWLNGLNSKRQEIEEAVHNEALAMLGKMEVGDGAIVLASGGWHLGVVGIVASRIAEKYYRPAIVLSVKDGVAKGSGRSIPPFDMHSGLTRCRDILKRFGGHKQAAGVGLAEEHITEFRERLSSVFMEELSGDDLIPVLNIDAAVKMSEVTIPLIDELARLEPFGYGNEEPVLGARNLEVLQPRIVGNNHLKMHLRQNGRRVDSIGFAFGELLQHLAENCRIDAAFLPVINEWDGGRYLQLNLKAIRPSRANGQ
ncbi:MAG: single-stranded-DNA-specific exonuclease RecJ [Alphaproteobacteria bacterium]|uniref:Single-stranded-DNA-specific exonuclease RecJ n=1 Tax=Candidatus Nitrobium versatile TaxID=2884831 RepID=A0A953M1Z0_9BACT|nr:single-stranded-DNA-specific exonuclease RecJ [Candidatus Nitrobium versatile]